MKRCWYPLNVFIAGFLLMHKDIDCSTTPCGRFEFPTLNDTVLTARENTTVSFPFTIVSDNCSFVDDQPKLLQVTRRGSQAVVLCQVLLQQGQCFTTQGTSPCTCSENTGWYQFTRTLTRSDNTTWRWSSGHVQDATISFFVLYPADVLNIGKPSHPPSVTSLSLSTSMESGPGPFSLYSAVDVICEWNDGHPAAQAFLLDRHSSPLKPVTYDGNRVRYSYPAVHCDDAGLIRCEAPGASHNKTETLLVKCPPQFDEQSVNVTVAPHITNTTADIEFKVRTHTKMVAKCKLTNFALRNKSKMAPGLETKDSSQNAKDCTSVSTLTGTPPDLRLTVRLDNMRKEEEGQWRLELTNDVGSGYVDFSLNVEGPPEFQSTDCKQLVAGTGDGNWEATFQLRTHTQSFLRCRVWKLASASKSDKSKTHVETTHLPTTTSATCMSLTGTPPDLTLTVRLDNVGKEEEGQWRLELTNDAGTGHVDVYLVKPGSTCPANQQPEKPLHPNQDDPLAAEDTVDSSTETATRTQASTSTTDAVHVYPEFAQARIDFTVLGSVTVAAISLTVIAVSIIRNKRERRSHEQPDERSPEPMNMEVHEAIHYRPGTDSGQSANYYWEIPDETPPSSPEPPRRCLSPALPTDYLHPSVSRDVTEETDGARNLAPLYENSQLLSLSDKPAADTSEMDSHTC